MKQKEIHLGTHGEEYGNWMSNPVFYMVGGVLHRTKTLASGGDFCICRRGSKWDETGV